MKGKRRATLLLALICLSVGCGSGSHQVSSGSDFRPTGRAVLTITWPARSRLIPVAAGLIRITFTDSQGTVVGQQDVSRPTQGNTATATFALPIEQLDVRAAAYADNPITAVSIPLAQGIQQGISIQINQPANVQITMDSTIDHLDVSPATPSVPNGQTLILTATARDSINRMVLVSSNTLQWISADPATAKVDVEPNATAVVTGLKIGTTQITVTETESGKTKTFPVTVINGGAHFIIQ